MLAPDVLIVTQAHDPTTDYLLPYLQREGLTWCRWDPGTVPTQSAASMQFAEGHWHDFTIVLEYGEQVRLDDVGVIWYRRPSTHHAPPCSRDDPNRESHPLHQYRNALVSVRLLGMRATAYGKSTLCWSSSFDQGCPTADSGPAWLQRAAHLYGQRPL
jgi:hypothetical protein